MSDPPVRDDLGVAVVGGYVCQNFAAHPGTEVEMMTGPYIGYVCPECGRAAGGPDDEIPYSDEPAGVSGP